MGTLIPRTPEEAFGLVTKIQCWGWETQVRPGLTPVHSSPMAWTLPQVRLPTLKYFSGPKSLQRGTCVRWDLREGSQTRETGKAVREKELWE